MLQETLLPVPPPLRLAEEGKVVRVGNTRVPLDTVVYHYENGASPEEIVHNFPTLDLADVHAVIAYYLNHKAEVQGYLDERERLAVEIRREIEQRFPQDGLRERLLARRAERSVQTK